MKLTEQELTSRHDFEELMLTLLSPLKPYYSKEKALLKLGDTEAVYDHSAALAEGFLRPLWGLIPYWAGNSHDGEFESIYQKGLAAGTDPDSPEYWGGFHNIDQRFVEMAAIAYGMLMVPEILWDPLTEKSKGSLAKWLDGINHYDSPPCNWMFFGILVNIALKFKHMPYSQARLDDYLAYIESCYQGNGWYVDGQNAEKDYYISFAFHYYSLIYIRFMKADDPDRCREYEKRAQLFAKDFVYWFAEDGSSLAYGRSLTYRLAQVAFFSMCTACELEVLPFPVMKGLITRHLIFWLDHPILDRDGILTIGYGYPNLLMSEQYNAPGSPYWCMKTFALLALPKEHPFWSMESAALPPLASTRLISNGDMLIQRLNGRVTAYVAGRSYPHQHVHTEEKYSKFAYSSKYAFSVPRSLHTIVEAAPDSMLAFEWNGMIYTKGITEYKEVGSDYVLMNWSPCPGIQVKTRITLEKSGHRRTHEITCDQPCVAYDCGFAFPVTTATTTDSGDRCTSSIRYGTEFYQVKAVHENGVPYVIHPSPNTNLMVPQTIIPCIKYQIHAGQQLLCTEFKEDTDSYAF
ncbi:MAG: DUF2264 domain-containing protein [Hungatella sp.]